MLVIVMEVTLGSGSGGDNLFIFHLYFSRKSIAKIKKSIC
jgi:cadmium resistance protein CadD (predicted permease)